LSVFEFDPRIQFEKEKLSVSVSAISVRIGSIFMPSRKDEPTMEECLHLHKLEKITDLKKQG
jgi:hypothetical protein